MNGCKCRINYAVKIVIIDGQPNRIPIEAGWEHCDWCLKRDERLRVANAFCEVAAKMDSFDYHPLMIAWKELQTPNERNEQ